MQFLACQPSSSISFHFPSKTHIPVPPKTPPPTLRPLLPTSASSAPRRTHVLLSRPRARDADEARAGDADLELLGKPSSVRSNVSEGEEAVSEKEQEAEGRPRELEEALAPFVKFFKSRDAAESSSASAAVGNGEDDEDEEQEEEGSGLGASPDVREGEQVVKDENLEKVAVEYYDPKPGALVVGVVVSGNEHKIDVNVGADLLGTMLTKEVLPLHGGELANSSYDLDKDVEDLMLPGKIGIVKDDEALEVERVPGRPVVEVGTVLFAEVLGRNLSGRPLLSSRRMFRRVAWHRVKQIKQLNEPIEVRITEWNTGGLLTRIEGLRAFLPKAELMNRINNFTDLKENVGRRMHVCITKIDDANNDLIISERVAWDMQHLQEGTLLEGTVCKIFPFGAQVKIGETKRSGLLHISNITRARVESVGDLLKVDEKVKVLVLDSMFPEKISLSIADLESVPGLFISDKERVFSEAETMAKKYKRRLRAIPVYRKSSPLPQSTLPFDDESRLYSNWKWFKFDRDNGMV